MSDIRLKKNKLFFISCVLQDTTHYTNVQLAPDVTWNFAEGTVVKFQSSVVHSIKS